METAPPAGTDTISVWLVEDEARYRETVAFLVDHTAGMRCAHALADSEAALGLLDQPGLTPPAVVLMDINLPGLSGIACAAQIKARLPGAQIVMLTIHDDEDTIFKAFRAGASGYLLKNAPVDAILAAIREAARGGMLIPPQVARKVLDFFAEQVPNRSDYGLTEREKAVLHLMIDGLIQKEIADRLYVSPSTVNGHIQHIYEKLHVHSSSAAVAKALRERLL